MVFYINRLSNAMKSIFDVVYYVMDEIASVQMALCQKYNSTFTSSPLLSKIGIARNFSVDDLPIHGLRHPPEGDTTGWYIWSGEWSDDSDFFVPLHTVHLVQRCPNIIRFLGLSPGWRFMFADFYEDVWQDHSLLNV